MCQSPWKLCSATVLLSFFSIEKRPTVVNFGLEPEQGAALKSSQAQTQAQVRGGVEGFQKDTSACNGPRHRLGHLFLPREKVPFSLNY
jgi:hypothetical protein